MQLLHMTERLDCELKAANLVHDRDIIRVVVENDEGLRGIAFLSVKIVNGRPKFTLTTKKNHGNETVTAATADWMI
jgi:hypothetical protein